MHDVQLCLAPAGTGAESAENGRVTTAYHLRFGGILKITANYPRVLTWTTDTDCQGCKGPHTSTACRPNHEVGDHEYLMITFPGQQYKEHI